MVSNFPEILATFVHDTKRIREIIGDTRKCFKEINSYENEDSSKFQVIFKGIFNFMSSFSVGSFHEFFFRSISTCSIQCL